MWYVLTSFLLRIWNFGTISLTSLREGSWRHEQAASRLYPTHLLLHGSVMCLCGNYDYVVTLWVLWKNHRTWGCYVWGPWHRGLRWEREASSAVALRIRTWCHCSTGTTEHEIIICKQASHQLCNTWCPRTILTTAYYLTSNSSQPMWSHHKCLHSH